MTYVSAVLADSPSVLLPLNEATTSFVDASPNAHVQAVTQTLTANQAGISSELTATALFGGGTIAEDFGSATAYSALTVEVWYKSTSGQGSLWTSRGSTGTGFTLFVGVAGAGFGAKGKVSFGLDGSSAYQGVLSSITVHDGAWHHIVGVFSRASGSIAAATDFQLYIDGALATVTNQSVSGTVTAPVTPSMNWQIGRHAGGWGSGTLSATYLSAIAVYSSALSSTNVASHYNAMRAAMPPTSSILSQASLEVITIPTSAPRALSHASLEVVTIPTVTPRALSMVSMEVLTGGVSPPRALSSVTMEVLTGPAAPPPRALSSVVMEVLTSARVPVLTSSAYVESLTFSSSPPRVVSSAYVESLTTSSSPPRVISSAYVESLTSNSSPPRAISSAYVEVLTPAALRPMFIGWGMPIAQ